MYNLHIYGGIPQEKLNVVLIIFAGATPIALNNETYHTKFNVDNPNLVLLDELQKAGVKILACAQSMALHKINPTSLTSRVAPALSRFTALSTYQLKGYATFIL
jgi:intracellular sulfur oxidation DsrE/DsrF family protein